MIPENHKIKTGDWIVADRGRWHEHFYILPGARLKVVKKPLSNHGYVQLCFNLGEFIQIFPKYSITEIRRDFSLSGNESEGIPCLRNRYDIAKGSPVLKNGVSETEPIKADLSDIKLRRLLFSDVVKIIDNILNVRRITRNSRLIEDLNADSLDLVELIIAFEDKYEIDISNEEVENIKTVNDIYEYLIRKTSEIL